MLIHAVVDLNTNGFLNLAQQAAVCPIGTQKAGLKVTYRLKSDKYNPELSINSARR
jgi:hypothetical protein